jgi:hypothetical protein
MSNSIISDADVDGSMILWLYEISDVSLFIFLTKMCLYGVTLKRLRLLNRSSIEVIAFWDIWPCSFVEVHLHCPDDGGSTHL